MYHLTELYKTYKNVLDYSHVFLHERIHHFMITTLGKEKKKKIALILLKIYLFIAVYILVHLRYNTNKDKIIRTNVPFG